MSTKQIFTIAIIAIGASLLSMFELTQYIFNWIITDGQLGLAFFVAYVLIALKFGKSSSKKKYVNGYEASLNRN